MSATTDNAQAIAEAAALLRAARFAVAFTGAGISTPSGIPDFRNPKSGLWAHTDPLAVASIYGFRQNPQAFYDWVYPLARRVVTENIDMLHTRAGSKTVHEIHGSLRQATCTHCFAVYPGEAILERFLQNGQTPHCTGCGGVIKPDVILFGEQLPYRPLQAAREAASRADVMLVIGSSLEVAPASHLPQIALRHNAKLITINYTPTEFDRFAHAVIHADAAEILPALARHCLKAIV
jgi:NAD-dependent deacetylase